MTYNGRTNAILTRFLAFSLMSLLSVAHAQGRPIVTVTSGPLLGSESGEGMRAFLGIPYAAAPVGDLRWRAPQPVVGWKEPRDATSFGAACPQPDDRFSGLTPKVQDEACLYLNVWAPKKSRCPAASDGVAAWRRASLRRWLGAVL